MREIPSLHKGCVKDNPKKSAAMSQPTGRYSIHDSRLFYAVKHVVSDAKGGAVTFGEPWNAQVVSELEGSLNPTLFPNEPPERAAVAQSLNAQARSDSVANACWVWSKPSAEAY